jgi:hypothetical protein
MGKHSRRTNPVLVIGMCLAALFVFLVVVLGIELHR